MGVWVVLLGVALVAPFRRSCDILTRSRGTQQASVAPAFPVLQKPRIPTVLCPDGVFGRHRVKVSGSGLTRPNCVGRSATSVFRGSPPRRYNADGSRAGVQPWQCCSSGYGQCDPTSRRHLGDSRSCASRSTQGTSAFPTCRTTRPPLRRNREASAPPAIHHRVRFGQTQEQFAVQAFVPQPAH